jgi:hypothetical protein
MSDNKRAEKFLQPVEDIEVIKPVVKLVGRDGNAFAILGACRKAAMRAGWPAERVKAVLDEMTSGDYDHLLATATEHFDVR